MYGTQGQVRLLGGLRTVTVGKVRGCRFDSGRRQLFERIEERNGEMLKFKKSECNCMICGNKNMEGGNEEMNIIRDRGDNLIAFSVCRKCRIRMVYELDSHNREWDKN